MKQHIFKRLLSLMLAAVMVLGLIPGASAASGTVQWKKSRTEPVTDRSDRLVEDQIHTPDEHKPTDQVRVSIVLEDPPTLKAGYSTQNIAANAEARAYDQALKQAQEDVADAISRHALGGEPLDVVWNLTLAANIISANVPYGKLDAIEDVSGVREVVLEQSYEAPVDQGVQTNTHSSSAMVGASEVWETGLTGAGTRIAIIDTGIDTDHQSFDNESFLHALDQTGRDYASLDLLDVQGIDSVLALLNAGERIGSASGKDYFFTDKIPFGANYVDRNLTIDHDHDYQGSHGSHVAGIAAANRFIPKNGGFLAAEDSVRMMGVAPDAQIVTMKVFGNSAGPYDSDFFAAIEDAIWLGCDSVNLSLGSGSPGSSGNPLFSDLLNFLATTDTVVTMSAGNSGNWAETTANGYLYNDGVSFQTSGSPGTYTNSLSVASVDNSQTLSDNGTYTMSVFSSWGVPGSLEMKPEITAPGGNIYSVNGVDPSGTAYETMSGTSMAAPQVAGMAALVSQYIRENGLDSKTGLSVRHLAQSLLMSTAVPILESGSEGGYYSILNQGSGLARVDLAVSADSYLLAEGMDDGKVKVELGDDPDREGLYRFSFSISDLSGQAKTYALSADLFTQAVFQGDSGDLFLDTATRPLDAAVTFSGNGVRQESTYPCDLNGDGFTDADDADHLLEYLLGNVTELYADGDVDGDGNLDSHDAHLLLSRFTGCYSVIVPANGTVTVEVTTALTDAEKALLAQENPTGAYIEAFVHAKPRDDGAAHSIPVLGYYGSWTEPSMYDIGRYHDHTTGQETRSPYLNNINSILTNYLTIDYGTGKDYIFGGNPLVSEEEYLPQRNAFNNAGSARLMDLRYTLIRNATAARIVLENADTGEILMTRDLGSLAGAYYHTTTGYWQNTQARSALELTLDGYSEGTTLNLSLIAAPEMYCTYDRRTGTYTADWDSLSSGAYLTIPVTIDNTEPELLDLQLVDGRYLQIKAKDNEYIAAAFLMSSNGTTLRSTSVNQTQPGAQITIEMDLKDVFGQKFQLLLSDYAENLALYDITLELSSVRPALTAYNYSALSYVGLDTDGNTLPLAPVEDRKSALAAEYAEGMVYEITEDHQLYLGSDGDLTSFRLLGQLDPEDQWKIANFLDLAYHRSEKKLYTLFYSNLNDKDMPYLAAIDPYNGLMTVLGEMPIDAFSLAIDGEGNFYSGCYGFSRLYTYRSDVISTGKTTLVGVPDGYKTTELHSMAWDHNKNVLYWAVNSQNSSTLVTVDPATAATAYVARFPFAIRGLYIAYEPDESVFAPVDTVESVTTAPTAALMKGNSTELTAQVWPWNVRDDSVTWTSDNPAVVDVVIGGVIMAHSAGTAVVTAASNLDPTKTASCTVTVDAVDRDLIALIWDEDGSIWWSSFNTDALPSYTKRSAATKPFNATMTVNGQLYASTLDTAMGYSELYRVDPKTYAFEKVGASSVAYMDMAYAPSLGYGLGVYFGYVVLIDLNTGEYAGAWPWSEGGAADLVGITYCGTSWNDVYKAYMDEVLILDANGNVYRDFWLNTGSNIGYFNGPEYGFLAQIGSPVVPSYFQGFHYDGEYVFWTRYNEPEDQVELVLWDLQNTGGTYSLGMFPEHVWPVGGLYTDADLSSSKALGQPEPTRTAIHPMTTAALPAQSVMPLSKAVMDQDNQVAVDITLPYDATNAILEVSYDPEKLEFESFTGLTEAFAWTTGNGSIRIAVASGETISGRDAAASLSFSPIGEGETTLTVTTTELGIDHLTLTETLTITLGHVCPSESFVDVKPGDWWHEAVDYVVSRGYMNGMDATHYGPAATMNRAQFVTVLYRMEGQPQVSNTGVFTDVAAGQFFTEAAYWALEAGITTGATPTTFNPGGQLTRTELVTFMYRYARYKGYDTTATADLSIYRDQNQILSFALEPWRWSVTMGIVSGMTADTLAPMSLTNRAQAAIIFQRFDNKLAG